MKKKLAIVSIMVLTLLIVGVGFTSAQDFGFERVRGSMNKEIMGQLFGSREDKALITPEFLEDDEVIAKIAQHSGMTVEEVKSIISEHKEKFDKKERRGHMGKGIKGDRMDMGIRMKNILENEELLAKMAERKGVTVEELRTWIENCPFLENN